MQETIIKPHARLNLGLKELITYRELLFYFAWRDLKVRYKQTVIGAAWAVIQPLASTAVFTLFFNKVAGIETGSALVPYSVFAYLGLLYWNLFNATLTKASNSIVDNQGVITKIYFPRLIPPISSGVLGVVDFSISSILFFVLLVVYNISPSIPSLLLMGPMVVVTLLTSLGAGMFFASLNVKYRDIRQALPFMIQILMFLTPVIYPITLVPDQYQWILYLNPICGVISLLRSSILGLGEINNLYLLLSFSMSVVIFIVGLVYFKHKERGFADII